MASLAHVNTSVEWLQEREKFTLPVLKPVSPCFTIPPLDNKPQDPIIQTIRSSSAPKATSRTRTHHIPSQLLLSPALSNVLSLDTSERVSMPALWNEASATNSQDTDRSMSWDEQFEDGSNRALNTPFLTEQHSGIFSLSTRIGHPSGTRITATDFFSSLHSIVLGTSSPLYTWDVDSQSFVRVVPLDAFEFEGMSPSILQRFLDLGSLVRRLDQLTQKLQERQGQGRTNTTIHAFAHGLSTVLMSIRHRLSRGPLSCASSSEFLGVNSPVTLWLYYDEPEQIMVSLVSMCSRNSDPSSRNFIEISVSPIDLLTIVYETFELHVERHSPRNVTAVIAYILTVSSKPYIFALSKLLAFGETHQASNVATGKTLSTDFTFEADEAESSWRGEESSTDAEGPFPKFVPENLASILPAAHKSLKLLEAAQPEHPMFSTESSSKGIAWLWDEQSIQNLWNKVEVEGSPIVRGMNTSRALPDSCQTDQFSGDHHLLEAFRAFDLEPGSLSSSEYYSQAVLDEFIISFPITMPSITPSPSILCEVMFSPLRDHAAFLSRALLAVFLDRSSFLCIDAHLELLRSHMLLTSHSFKSRLSVALFSDAEDRETLCEQLYSLLRYKSKSTVPLGQSYLGRWPVGLAPLLVTRDSWPPGGSELSFLLRTVIVDSQQTNSPSAESTSSSDCGYRVMGEAESRLGFAIRELSGRGHDRWLDPLSIEALDFLYLDYKVPQPLQSLIPAAVLSKYQRIFALLLRLTRVECAIRSIFRLTRTTAIPLFPTLASSRRLLLHFRFVAHSFLTTLSTYIYDTAIGGNFDTFLLRIAACRETPDAANAFRDVFALAECHSSVLDDILSACLLRSTQRAASELLRGTLEVVLEFCVLMGDLKESRMEEYQASPVLEALYVSFRRKTFALMRALEVMLEGHGKPLTPGQFRVAYPERDSHAPGGVGALRHLLTCLNQNDWWTRSSMQQSSRV